MRRTGRCRSAGWSRAVCGRSLSTQVLPAHPPPSPTSSTHHTGTRSSPPRTLTMNNVNNEQCEQRSCMNKYEQCEQYEQCEEMRSFNRMRSTSTADPLLFWPGVLPEGREWEDGAALLGKRVFVQVRPPLTTRVDWRPLQWQRADHPLGAGHRGGHRPGLRAQRADCRCDAVYTGGKALFWSKKPAFPCGAALPLFTSRPCSCCRCWCWLWLVVILWWWRWCWWHVRGGFARAAVPWPSAARPSTCRG